MGKKRYYKIKSDPTKLQKYRQKRKEYMKKISQSWKGWINEEKILNTQGGIGKNWRKQILKNMRKFFLERARKRYWEKKNKKEV